MDLHFLGGATTVTGSQYLLETGRARVLIDCGMFQGSPNEAMRNRVPLAYDPATLDVMLLTHAHLDHCGLIPHLIKEGYGGRVIATKGTCELAELVMLDSGKLQEEFAKREARWEKKHPDLAAADDRKEEEQYQEAVDVAAGKIPAPAVHESVDDAPPPLAPQATSESAILATANTPEAATIASDGVSEEVPEATAHPSASPTVNPETALREQPAEMHTDLDEPLYTADDAAVAVTHFDSIGYDEEREVAPGVHATFLDAGHILGSAMIRLRVEAAGPSGGGPERETTIVFSGDLGRPDTPIIRDPTIQTSADYVLCESTYGGREHEPEDEATRILTETVHMVSDAGGVLLIPSFAIGRTQEIVYALDRLLEAGKIPQLPLYLDSPMASKASDIYRRHADYFDEDTRRLLASGDTPLDYPNQTETRDFHDSQKIAQAPRPYMIIASNGMLTGGRVLGHLRNLIGDPTATLLFVGYQGIGTLGAHLQAGATTVKLDGQPHEVRCKIRSISGFSAHADESELLDWLRHFAEGKTPGAAGFPKIVFLVHGDPEAQIAIEPKVQALGFTTKIPHWRETATLA
ncbi:MAG: metallo-beta-lactamase family protein [Chloroflexota bacterium]|jgi:Cft2 family RNA processing exonuclease|nr:metallo-beta-lactamase family protein [Chloroflexota bacterium]